MGGFFEMLETGKRKPREAGVPAALLPMAGPVKEVEVLLKGPLRADWDRYLKMKAEAEAEYEAVAKRIGEWAKGVADAAAARATEELAPIEAEIEKVAAPLRKKAEEQEIALGGRRVAEDAAAQKPYDEELGRLRTLRGAGRLPEEEFQKREEVAYKRLQELLARNKAKMDLAAAEAQSTVEAAIEAVRARHAGRLKDVEERQTAILEVAGLHKAQVMELADTALAERLEEESFTVLRARILDRIAEVLSGSVKE